MTFLRSISPLRAIRDLRRYLAGRPAYEIWFLMLAMALTLVVIWAFVKDSNIAVPYKRNIIYVESWPLSRTDAEIRAQQKIDQAKKEAQLAELEKKRKQRQEEFKRVDESLKKWGI
ncbi:V-type proton ATPase subunit G [Sphingomonas sp. S2-65]|uniref:V-type proton ATPase subunit G n=1 Tax=Sphingomonas sp. S2-65 TaxID=2903960 RepID=UPI001F42AA9F|nr:V-type proton ATPase subunit G [Sphingomonas sp. S2-65]UYY57254.1 V-type proton ATPase subunit G [Sphingomonas sp. S2-65]